MTLHGLSIYLTCTVNTQTSKNGGDGLVASKHEMGCKVEINPRAWWQEVFQSILHFLIIDL